MSPRAAGGRRSSVVLGVALAGAAGAAGWLAYGLLRREAPDDPLEGLSPAEAHALRYALAEESSPQNLLAFGSAFLPDYPEAGALLLARGRALRAEATARRLFAPLPGAAPSIQPIHGTASPNATPSRVIHQEASKSRWMPTASGSRAAGAFRGSLKPEARSHAPGGAAVGDLLDVVATFFDPLDVARPLFDGSIDLAGAIYDEYTDLAPLELRMMVDLARGQSLGDAMSDAARAAVRNLRAAAQIVKVAGPFLAYVPGLGTGAAMALELGASLALGEDLDQAVVDGLVAAVPGGPLAQAAVRTAASAVDAAARGRSADAALLEGLREGIRQEAGEEAAVAFDAGVAVAQGKRLQDWGLRTAVRAMEGSDLAHDAEAFASDAYLAALQARQPLDLALDSVTGALDRAGMTAADVEAAVKPLVRRILDDPRLDPPGDDVLSALRDRVAPAGSPLRGALSVEQLRAALPPPLAALSASELADEVGVEPEVARAARALVLDAAGGRVTINRRAWARIFPRAPGEVGAAALEAGRTALDPAKHAALVPLFGRVTSLAAIAQGAARGARDAVREAYEVERGRSALLRDWWVRSYLTVEHGGMDPHALKPPTPEEVASR